MNLLFRAIILTALTTLVAPAVADSGPRVPPCEGCPVSVERPYPRSGFWYDPQRSGTGFTIEMQRGILSGAYYGFDETGARTWYIFNGTLQPSEQPGEYWTVETDLLEFSGGSCIDCAHRPNQPPQVRHRMRLTVLQRNLISYSLDGGPEFRVQPLVYGTQMAQLVPEHSDAGLFQSPETPPHFFDSSPWQISVRDPVSPQNQNAWDVFRAGGIRWSSGFRQSEAAGRPVIASFRWYPLGSIEIITDYSVFCNDRAGFAAGTPVPFVPDEALEGIGPGVFCVVRTRGETVGTSSYFIGPLANFGDDYFFATAADGRIIEGIRLRYR